MMVETGNVFRRFTFVGGLSLEAPAALAADPADAAKSTPPPKIKVRRRRGAASPKTVVTRTDAIAGSSALAAVKPTVERVDATALAPPAVERIAASDLTPALFERRFRATSTPVVVTGLLRNQEADPWRLSRFCELLDPAAAYSCRIHGGDGYAQQPGRWTGKSHARHTVLSSARKFAEAITTGVAAREDCYVQHDISTSEAGQLLAPALAELGERAGLRLHAQHGALVNMWWGPPGHTEPLHMDCCDGTLLQLRGRKRIVLFPARCWAGLRPFPVEAERQLWAFSRVSRAELAGEGGGGELAAVVAQKMEVVLDEGEALYIPACCAHEISGEHERAKGVLSDHVLSVNRFWATDAARVTPHLPDDARAEFLKSVRAKAGASASGRAAEVDARTEGLWELMRSLGPTKEGSR